MRGRRRQGLLDDEPLRGAEDGALGTSSRLQPEPDGDELALLGRLDAWARQHTDRPDAKARHLLTLLGEVCR